MSIFSDLNYIFHVVLNGIIYQHDFTKPIVINKRGDNCPIVLVHGSSGNQAEFLGALSYIKTYLPEHPAYAFSLDLSFDPNTGEQNHGDNIKMVALKQRSYNHNYDINKYANLLFTRVQYVKKQHKCDKVILIGQSMGGLISTQYDLFIAGNDVERVFLISSPINGTPRMEECFGKFLTQTRHEQMTPGSDFLTRIAENLPSHIDKYWSFGSEQDFQVPDAWAQIHESHHTTINGYGHVSINKSPELWANIAVIINQ